MTTLVFAYGSNLCIERLRARTPSARVVATARLAGHALRWHKKASDGSGKCDAFETGLEGDLVWGAVYELSRVEKKVLDGFEGLGRDYFDKIVSVETAGGESLDAVVYVANGRFVEAGVRPWCWYRGFVTVGARQHALPPDYRDALDATEFVVDPDPRRRAREEAVLRLAAKGG